jgi:hypothetical protein
MTDYKKTLTVFLFAATVIYLCPGTRAANGADNVQGKNVPTVEAVKVDKEPVIDGKLDEPLWTQIALDQKGVMAGWRLYGSAVKQPTLAPQNRIAYVCYDDKNLYIGMQAFMVDVMELCTDKNSSVFTNVCLEVHIKLPDGKYYQLGIDALGRIGGGQITGFGDILAIHGAAGMSDNFWTAELAIPWNFLGIVPKAGLEIGFNLAANVANQGTKGTARQSITWAPSYWVKNYEAKLRLR